MLSRVVRFPALSMRMFSSSSQTQFYQSATLLAARSAKTPEQKKLDELKTKLKKEKQVYKSLKTKFSQVRAKEIANNKKAKAKEAAKKQKAKNSELLKKAFKNYRKLSPFNMFLKDAKGKDLISARKEWNDLSAFEQENYQDKADDYNEELKNKYTPKPKPPTFGFAKFVQENYAHKYGTNVEIVKQLSEEWKELSDSEKSQYKKDESQWKAYQDELQAWKVERVKLFNEANGTELSL